MKTRTIYRLGLVTGMAGLLLAAAVGFVSDDRGSEAGWSEERASHGASAAATVESASSERSSERPRLDVAFVIDVTGSMQDEIEVIKTRIWEIASEIAAGRPTPDVRFGLVLYRDKTDEFVVRHVDLTRNVEVLQRRLVDLDASGGGDHREHLLAGLDQALELDWESSGEVVKKIYLVGDAPGHTDYADGRHLEGLLEEANDKGIRIDSIGCSGIGRAGGKRQFARISAGTSGTYQSLTYHAVVEDDHGEPQSVVYRDGEVYVAEEVLSTDEWQRRSEELIESGRVERAGARTALEARRAAERTNNFRGLIGEDMQQMLDSEGVDY